MASPNSVRDRQWRLVRLLGAQKRGVTAAQLMEKLGASRATVYRDLEQLEKAGFPVVRSVQNGETRISLPVSEVPAAEPTPAQVHALRLARMAIGHLDGSWVTKELDTLLRAYRPAAESKPTKVISVRPPKPNGESTTLAALEEAIRKERGVRFVYRASSRGGEESKRQVDPRKIRALPDGATYLIAWDVGAKDWRTFKLVRMANVELEKRGWEKHPSLEEYEAQNKKALRAWSGEPIRVRIRLEKDVAWLASEYALPGQTAESQRDGSVIVTAEVTGLVEVMRWTLGWGKCAKVLEPKELVAAMRGELETAAQLYG